MLLIFPQVSLAEEALQIEHVCSSVFQQSSENTALERAFLEGMADKTLENYLVDQRICL